MTIRSDETAGGAIARVVGRLVEFEAADSVYADVYRRRAQSRLGSVLSAAQYEAAKSRRRQRDKTLEQTRMATMRQDWRRVASLAARVEEIGSVTAEEGALIELGAQVYDAPCVHLDPFSPGFASVPEFENPAGLRAGAVDRLKALSALDAPFASFYDSRRDFLRGLVLADGTASAARSRKDAAAVAILAAEAAHRGDMGQLRRLAEELVALEREKAEDDKDTAETKVDSLGTHMYHCPVDLGARFDDGLAQRARALGFAVAHAEALPQTVALHDYAVARICRDDFSDTEVEREGTMRAQALVDEAGLPADITAPVKILVAQFLRNRFINSGGARYVPRFTAETVLIEDFPEDREPANGELLSALGLDRRRALAREEIEHALLNRAPAVLEERLGLDPIEFRLVCIPHDLYMRFGPKYGWGQQQELWTHFDGYQVFRTGTRRALVGGDRRYGGVTDLVSLSPKDERERVIARFAVIRRARQVARWR